VTRKNRIPFFFQKKLDKFQKYRYTIKRGCFLYPQFYEEIYMKHFLLLSAISAVLAITAVTCVDPVRTELQTQFAEDGLVRLTVNTGGGVIPAP
jgi:hypothetical protein